MKFPFYQIKKKKERDSTYVCALKQFKVCTVYPRIRSFWIYTIVSFFKTFSPLFVYVKILSIFKKEKRKKIIHMRMDKIPSITKDISLTHL